MDKNKGYSVAFKKPGKDGLVWVDVPTAVDPLQASRAARDKCPPGYQEYGISAGTFRTYSARAFLSAGRGRGCSRARQRETSRSPAHLRSARRS